MSIYFHVGRDLSIYLQVWNLDNYRQIACTYDMRTEGQARAFFGLLGL